MLFGANEPAPLQVAPVAAPPYEPLSVTVLPLAQIVWLPPALTVAAAWIVTTTCEVAAAQGDCWPVVLSVSVTVPAVISAGDGV